MFKNLISVMARRGIPSDDLARILGIHRNTLLKKIKGESEFTLTEADVIHAIFNEYDYKYLFTREQEKILA